MELSQQLQRNRRHLQSMNKDYRDGICTARVTVLGLSVCL